MAATAYQGIHTCDGRCSMCCHVPLMHGVLEQVGKKGVRTVLTSGVSRGSGGAASSSR